MKNLKIALVYDAIYPYTKGGGERRFYELGTRLVKDGHEVHWYGMKFWDGPDVVEHDGIVLHGLCKARPLYTKSGRRSISQALIFGLSSFKLLGADFDVIDCCGFPYFSLFPAKLAAIIKRKPLFATWHEVWGKEYWKEYLGKAGFIGYWVERLAAKMPTYVITNSGHTADMLKTQFNISAPIVIPNGIDTAHIANVKPSKEQADVIYVGRLMDFKQVDLIIKALVILKAEGLRLSCTIIGKGPDQQNLRTLATKSGVSQQINWLHSLDIDDVYAHMKASRVFVLPSKREGFGIAALEANACGTPIVTNMIAGNAAKDLVIQGKNGFGFSQEKSNNLALVLNKALKNAASMKQDCVKYAKKYDWNSISKEVAEVYAA
jgi:glycosyltransferase involved in cell wall biosynthesis